jgi:cardiolipin synthase A/B
MRQRHLPGIPLKAALGSLAAGLFLFACSSGNGAASSSSAADTNVDCNFAAPTTSAGCQESTDQQNGCHGGYYCNTDSDTCKEPSYVTKNCPADAGQGDTGVDSGSPGQDAGPEEAEAPPAGPAIVSNFDTPSSTPSAGLQPVIDAIGTAKQTIEMEMFHLTVMAVAQALNAAASQGVTVRIIIDQDNWNNHTTAALKTELNVQGITVTPSSAKFRITHEKSFVIDNGTPQATAYIMSLNLTSPFDVTRDYAVSTQDANVIADFETVFSMDLANAQNGTASSPAPYTPNTPSTGSNPALVSPYTVLSPVNSQSMLLGLIASAKKSILVTSENLDGKVVTALLDAANPSNGGPGVTVQVISPQCDQNSNSAYDIPALQSLNSGNAQARAMPGNSQVPNQPSSAAVPYMHGKMMVVDGVQAYLGSVNLSDASETDAREFGLVISDPATIQMLSDDFSNDWGIANATPFPSVTCTPTP